jgi:hypothetical protein
MKWIWVLGLGVPACTSSSPTIESSPITVSGMMPTQISLASDATLLITGTGFAVEVLGGDTDNPGVYLPTVILQRGDIFPLDEAVPNSAGTELTATIRAQQLQLGSFQVLVSNANGESVQAPQLLEVDP